MTTRISKIARLPADIREQFNRRLHNGEVGRTLLPWVNNLPETKTVLAELFGGKAITHQNLSEWRTGGYQDWLMHQQRLDWFQRLFEQEKELEAPNQCGDMFETMSRFFIFELGQAFTAMQNIKNPEVRWAKLQHLTQEFARLQNSYNWSRRVGLEWEKYKDQFEEDDSPDPEPAPNDLAGPLKDKTRAPVAQTLPSPESRDLPVPNPEPSPDDNIDEIEDAARPVDAPASRQPVDPVPPSTVDPHLSPAFPDCGAPPPLPETVANTQPIPEFQPITTVPTPYPTAPRIEPKPVQPPVPKPYKVHSIPIRGRRFTCIEG
jgi:hypothetical protein